jgi:predicted MPP superfamily phosphohydrolase
MLRQVVGWLRAEPKESRRRGRLARLIGRNWARVSYGYRIEPTWLEINRLEVDVEDLPEAFDGFRIVQLSDFHCSRHVTPAYVAEAVELAMAEAPDLVALTGDFVHRGYKHVGAAAAALAPLQAPAGVFAVLGNHDYSVRNALGLRRYRHLHRAVAHSLSARGVKVLHNQVVPLIRQESMVYLVGVADLWSRRCDIGRAFAGLSPEIPCITLAHNPRTVERLEGRRCDLMLSGHTHGGQVNWPGVGRPALGRRSRRFAAGLCRHRGTRVYVNKGVGFGLRFRFGVRPEVAVFTLRRI